MGRFAVVGMWTMDVTKFGPEQERELHERIVPLTKSSPGFVEGRWSRDADGVHHSSFVLFDDRSAAERFADMVRGQADLRSAAGVANDSLQVQELIASA
jgi:hypothetical protein